MTSSILNTQAALVYRAPPVIDLGALRARINAELASSGSPALEDSPMSSDEFVLFRNARLHVTVAIHRTPLPTRGLQHALSAPATRSRRTDFAALIAQSRAHVIVSVGDGPAPIPLEPVTPAPPALKLALLHKTVSLLHTQSPAEALHTGANDLFHTAAEIETAATQAIVAGFVMHPLAADAPARALRMINSELLIGKVLEIHGIAEKVPVSMQLVLANTLVVQHIAGNLPLEDGDRLEDSVGMGLTIRHARPTAQAPEGRLVVAFDNDGLQRAPRWETAVFTPHPGYSAPLAPPAPAALDGQVEWIPPGAGGYSSRVVAAAENRSSNWMIWVGIGLFLWIGLPLLNIPQMILQATFSEDLVGPAGDTR